MAKKTEEVVQTEELTQEALIEVANIFEELSNTKKEVGAELSEIVKDVSSRFGIKPKELRGAIKAYLAWKTDRAKFNEESTVLEKLIDLLTGERCIVKIPESDL